MIEIGSRWYHARDDRTVEVRSTGNRANTNPFVHVVNLKTGRGSNLRESTLIREYRCVSSGRAS